jgi:hypothetical protein
LHRLSDAERCRPDACPINWGTALSDSEIRVESVSPAALDSRAMKIKELKEIIAKLPDEMLVFASQWKDWDSPNSVSEAKVQEIEDGGTALILKATDYYDDEDEEEDE